MRYFRYKEFDSPDLKRSGLKMMKPRFLEFIDELRHRCGFPFVITSGFRTVRYNQRLIESPHYKASPKSSHLKGIAADVSIRDAKSRALFVGHAVELCDELDLPLRIGIARTFCHIDLDTEKSSPRIWTY
tara:strand:+ start:25 stop:414 length:390 start_codon:yes stop_codon:yes gene_type:complete